MDGAVFRGRWHGPAHEVIGRVPRDSWERIMPKAISAAPAITASLGDSIINDLLDQLSYPFTLQLPSSRSTAGEEGELASEFSWAPDDGRAETAEDESDIGGAVLAAAVEGYLDAAGGGDVRNSSDREIYDLIAGRMGTSRAPDRDAVMAALEADRAAFAPALVDALARVSSVDIRWVKVTVVNRPSGSLGNPIRIGNLKLKVQAKVRVCVRVLGRRLCTDVTTPNVEFRAQEVRVALQTRGRQIWAVPSVKNIDLVVRVKFLGISFTFTIGVTGVVNGLLKNKSVMVFDAGALSFPLPTINRAFGVTAVEIPAGQGATTFNLTGAYTPI